jgi:hypothetical protein
MTREKGGMGFFFPLGEKGGGGEKLTLCINFLQIGRISLLSVALNIITCFA